MSGILILICFYFGSVLAQPDAMAFFNSTSNATVPTVLNLLGSTLLNFRTCGAGEILTQTGTSGDTFTLSIQPSGFVQASWTVGGVSQTADVGPNYSTNTEWVLLRLEYTVGTIRLSVGSNFTELSSDSFNSDLFDIVLSGGSDVVLGVGLVGCIEQVTGVKLDEATTWTSNVVWGSCPLESQQGCQPPDRNPCYSYPCKNNGVCSSNAQAPGGYTCECTARYEGSDCETDTGPLCDNPIYTKDCQNGGFCEEDDIGNSTYCQCQFPYEGELCERNTTFVCGNDTCDNNGTCTLDDNGVACDCQPGFSGDNCAININECTVHACLNNGDCIDGIDSYTCNCTGTGYSGEFCSVPIDECQEDTPCRNNGTCVDTSGGFVCLCPPGWTGSTCELDLNECVSNPCDNDGTCRDMLNGYYCDCLPGFSGFQCELNIDDCAGVTCPGTFICVDGIGSYTCDCPLGKENKTGTCEDIDECADSPCVNGDCLNLDNSYRCECFPGYNGTDCGLDIDDCNPSACLNGSTCLDQVNNFTCSCVPGFNGRLCGDDIDECLEIDCLNGATCIDGVNNVTCTCVPGFDGYLCGDNIDDCSPDPCLNEATCADGIDDYTCECLPGYADKNCSTDVDECGNDPCMNNATCVDLIDDFLCNCSIDYMGKTCNAFYDACKVETPCVNGTCSTPPLPSQEYTCNCSNGFNGTDCEVNIDDCVGVDCNVTSGRICFDEVDGYRCACPIGFQGPLCALEIDECDPDPCSNNGTCNDFVGRYNCSCVPGFAGYDCEVNIDDCDPNPCENNGRCEDRIDGYQCFCFPGYSGDECHVTINECLSEPCANGATCMDKVNGVECDCASGFEGGLCELDIDECLSGPCENNATCNNEVDGFNCTCLPGYNGTLCELDIDECAVNPCNIGSCQDAVNNYTCNCTDTGFVGAQCEVNIDDCLLSPCVNDGTCQDGVKEYTCACHDGYDGQNCSEDIDECADDPCLNSGLCLERSNQSLYGDGLPFPGEFSYANASGYVCECAAGFEGTTCEVNIDDCEFEPCFNNATCLDGVNDFVCNCPDGWEGDLCDIDIDECEPGPCQNDATCTDFIDGYECSCTSDYSGTNCSVLLTACLNNTDCQNGATCVPAYDEATDSHNRTCQCAPGYTGDTCTVETSASFEGDSYLMDQTTNRKTTLQYSLGLATTLPDGLLLYSGDTVDYFLVEMFNGDLRLSYRSGSNAPLEITDFGRPINDGDYHTVGVVITPESITLSVTIPSSNRRRSRRSATCSDGLCQQSIPIPDAYVNVQLDDMYIGGVIDPLADQFRQVSKSGLYFTGCIRDIMNGEAYVLPPPPSQFARVAEATAGCTRVEQCSPDPCNSNGVCTDLWVTFTCDCNIGYAGLSCNISFIPGTFRFENITESFAEFTPADDFISQPANTLISLAFRTREPSGLLFFAQDNLNVNFIAVEIIDEKLLVNLERSTSLESLATGSRVTDGVYHLLTVMIQGDDFRVILDGVTFNDTILSSPPEPVYTVCSLGGVSNFSDVPSNGVITSDAYFKGCLWDVKYNGYSLQFERLAIPGFPIPSFNLTLSEGVLLNDCESDDACRVAPCENDGMCRVTWNDFECDCPTGFGGKNCSELTICSEDPCPSGAECRDVPDGHECVIEATFDGVSSLLAYTNNINATTDLADITLTARTRHEAGIIFHVSDGDRFVTLYLIEGAPALKYNLGESGVIVSPIAINDGTWSYIGAAFDATQVVLTVGDTATPASHTALDSLTSVITSNTSGPVYLAGAVDVNNDFFINYNHFSGCLDDARIGGIHLPFFDRETLNSTSVEQFDAITITDITYECNGDPSICSSNPCDNTGTCRDVWNAFECECPPGFDGTTCGTDIDECDAEPCSLNATCIDEVNNFTCSCQPGYEGRTCGIDIDECQPDPCLQASTCYDGVDFFNCTCADGYVGALCNVSVNETCAGSPCKNGATCQDTTNEPVQFNCTCPAGYDGADCGNEVNYCLGVNCRNGGTCVVGDPIGGTFRCECVEGYSGLLCKSNEDNCPGVVCENGGTCVDGVDEYTCSCTPGYEGDVCGGNINECVPDPCQFGATCEDLLADFTCVCQPGYDGTQCQLKGPCVSPPCINGGQCQQTYNDADSSFVYVCDCPYGFNGTNCELEIDWCASDPCQQEGSNCTSSREDFSCDCGPGYNGTFCENKLPDCASGICLNNATCKDLDYGFKCLCRDGYSGDICGTDIDDCFNRPCLNNATCVDAVNGYICNCQGTGYQGLTCLEDVDECLTSPCVNNATCANSPGSYKCECAEGYVGTACQLRNPCYFDEPCANGGMCDYLIYNNARNISFSCTCVGDYDGEKCEKFTGTTPVNWALIGGVIGGTAVLLIIVIVLAVFLVSVKNKRATRGTYRPSQQEISGSRVEMDNIMKIPKEERLI